jgi:hypothetical protein
MYTIYGNANINDIDIYFKNITDFENFINHKKLFF